MDVSAGASMLLVIHDRSQLANYYISHHTYGAHSIDQMLLEPYNSSTFNVKYQLTQELVVHQFLGLGKPGSAPRKQN